MYKYLIFVRINQFIENVIANSLIIILTLLYIIHYPVYFSGEDIQLQQCEAYETVKIKHS